MLSRKDALAALTGETFDVVVVGGGITGAGVALDAASRGYTVALIERDDYAAGTSSRSSKMVHGGLRYLQNFDVGLVREALLERQLMVQLSPHLVYPTPFLVPTLGEDRRNRLIGIGLNMYDVMSTTRVGSSRRDRAARIAAGDYWAPDRHRTIDGAETAELLPALASRDPREAFLFYDCQTDDVRLVLTILGEAERFGAVCINRAEATGLIDRDGAAAGVLCRDRESGEEFEVEAENVVNATGVWADRLRPEEIHDEAEVPRIAPSRGTHVTLPLEKLNLKAACIVPAGEDRTIFALPWYGRALIGTTDRDYEGDLLHVEPSGDDITYLLDAVNRFFGTELGPADLTGAFAGVRPLISTGDPPEEIEARALPDGYRAQLAFRYGHAARKVLLLAAERPELARPIVPGRPDLLAEVALAARYEQATSVGDVLLRRTRLGLLAAPDLRGPGSVAQVARTLGAELGWDEARVDAERGRWAEEARAEGIDPAAS